MVEEVCVVVESPSDTLTIHPARRVDGHVSQLGGWLVANLQVERGKGSTDSEGWCLRAQC